LGDVYGNPELLKMSIEQVSGLKGFASGFEKIGKEIGKLQRCKMGRATGGRRVMTRP